MGLFDRFSKKNKSEGTETPQDNNLNPDDWFFPYERSQIPASAKHRKTLIKR